MIEKFQLVFRLGTLKTGNNDGLLMVNVSSHKLHDFLVDFMEWSRSQLDGAVIKLSSFDIYI